MLSGYEDLAIVQLVYWTPALVLTLIVSYKHGFGRQLGWILIALLALVRLIGSSCQIAYESETNPDSGLITAAAVTSSIGLSFILSVFIAMLTRVHEGMSDGPKIPPRALRLVQLIILVSIILGIVGGSDQAQFNDPSKVSSGQTLTKVSVILLLVVFVGLVLAFVWTVGNIRRVLDGERRLVYASMIALPFILVRLVFSIACDFAQTSTFNTFHPEIYVKAFMQVLMEFIIAAIVIATGFLTEAIPRHAVDSSRSGNQEVSLGQLSEGAWKGQSQQEQYMAGQVSASGYAQTPA